MELRASKLPLLMRCTGSLVMSCDESKSENADKAAAWGTMVHFWAQTGKVKGPNKRSENALHRAIALSGINRGDYWPDGGNHEGSLSVRVDGRREVSRDDSPRIGWVTGHYDYQYWLLDGELWIDDLKTGKVYPNPAPGWPGHMDGVPVGDNRYPQDVGSPQLKTYALALAELLEYRGPVTVSLTHWPRVPVSLRHSLPERLWTRYSHQELMNHWRDLEMMYEQAQHNQRAAMGHEDTMILVPGDWCKFCPAKDCLFK